LEAEPVDESTVRIASGVLAVLCVIALILRRRSKKKASDQDDF
jgi:hypothetical protein